MRLGFGSWSLRSFLTLAVLCLGAAVTHASPMPSYSISDLGTLPGTSRSIATGINAQGQIAGVSYSSSDGTWGVGGVLAPLSLSYDAGAESFLYSNGQMTRIDPSNGPATAINDAGQVVGGNYASINDAGQFVGSGGSALMYEGRSFPPDQFTANQFVSGGETTNIPVLPYSINDSGQIAGDIIVQARGAGENVHAAIEQNGHVTDLSLALGLKGRIDLVTALNNLGDAIITEGQADGSRPHYLLYSARTGHVTDLTALPGGSNFLALALNDHDQVVGKGLLYSGGQFIPLRDLLPTNMGWSNLDATAINDTGQIVGQGSIDGQEHSFLMTPGTASVPEPPSLAILGLGLVALGLKSFVERARKN